MKTCPTCGVNKPFSEFYRDDSRPQGVSGRCKQCARDQVNAYRKRNAAVVNAKKKAYRESHKAEIAADLRARYRANPDMWKQHAAKRVHEQCVSVGDDYVKLVLRQSGLKTPLITQELISLKREQLLLHRTMRQLKKAIEGEPHEQR